MGDQALGCDSVKVGSHLASYESMSNKAIRSLATDVKNTRMNFKLCKDLYNATAHNFLAKFQTYLALIRLLVDLCKL